MDDYALVLTAGASSLKFCVFRRPEDEGWQLGARGQIDGIGTTPRISAKDDACLSIPIRAGGCRVGGSVMSYR